MGLTSARLALLAAALGCGLAVACSSMNTADSFGSGDVPNAGTNPQPPPNDLGSSGASGGSTPTQQGPAAKGVVLVHAAAFPPFRLCFGNQLAKQPQPDSKVMPDANVVGVEQGSVIRLDPLEAPGEVFVIDEKVVQSAPGTAGPPCSQLICGIPGADPVGGATCLRPVNDYDSAGRIDRALGKAGVEVMGISGCGNQFMVGDPRVNVSQSDCGKPYDATKGNLSIKTVSLPPVSQATPSSIPVQLVHMSFLLENQKGTNALDVTFGTLSAMPSKPIAHDPTLFANGADTTLSVDQTNQAVYAQQGFRVAIAPPAGGTPIFSTDLSLADVQSLSSPREVPSDYYAVASNYALLLLGDPRITNDARRGVHLLAVPVLDPSQLDAGAEGGDSGPK